MGGPFLVWVNMVKCLECLECLWHLATSEKGERLGTCGAKSDHRSRTFQIKAMASDLDSINAKI